MADKQLGAARPDLGGAVTRQCLWAAVPLAPQVVLHVAAGSAPRARRH
ncbi:hypothetical protein [Segniliparus rotundus]|nr:hypothetical protein [Segniliparus rotundus]